MQDSERGTVVVSKSPRVVEPADWELADSALLRSFTMNRDESAFAALVQRHGPMVWGVCRRVLRDAHEAEDSFQATFLVLARRATHIQAPERLANWLYGVAYRTALKAQGRAARRTARERQVTEMTATATLADSAWQELQVVLDEELNQLPDKYRAALVLCYLEGQTNLDAARTLGWPEGTISRRLSRGRELLRERLRRRGVALSAGLLGLLLPLSAEASVSSPLLVAAAAIPTGAVSPSVVSLAEEVIPLLADSAVRTWLLWLLLGMSGLLIATQGNSLLGYLQADTGDEPAVPSTCAPNEPADASLPGIATTSE